MFDCELQFKLFDSGWVISIIIIFIIFFFHLRSVISILSDWVSFLAYPNLFGIKGFDVVVVVVGL
jgi:hypothetical protein